MLFQKNTAQNISSIGCDKEIVKGILNGDEKSLRIFYTRYKPSLSTFIRKKISDEKDVEEILQDTLIASIEAMRDFSYRCSLFTYICSIANHKIIDHYRRQKIKTVFFSKVKDASSIIDVIFDPEKEFDAKILKSKIKFTLEKLSPGYSVILRMKYIEGYSVQEIAEKLAISFKTVESRLFRARKAFEMEYFI